MILEIGNWTTYFNKPKNNEPKLKDGRSSMNNLTSLKPVPSFYLGHTSGTKNKWVKEVVKEFYVIRVLINLILRRVELRLTNS